MQVLIALTPSILRAIDRPAIGLCLLTALGGCTRQNPAFDENDTDASASASAGASTSTSTSSSTTGPSTSDGSTTAADTGGTATAGDGSSGLDPTTSSTAATLTGVDPGTSTSTSTDATSSTGDPMDPPPPEHLQLYDPQNCTMPLWCYNTNDGVFAGVPARTGSQACFTPTTPPPYGLTRVGYVIAAAFGGPAAALQIHERTGMGPGKLITELPLDANGLTVGPHALVFNDPIVIDVPAFCLGLIGGSKDNPAAGLGVAVDTTMLPPQQSFLRIDGGGGCNLPNWSDIATVNPTPKGAWCIDADIAKQP